MAAMKFACFLLVILLMSAWLNNAHAHEAVEFEAVSTEKRVVDVVGERTIAAAAATDNKIRGRKMGANIVKRPDIINGGTSKLSSANQVAGKGGYKEKEVMNVGNKPSVSQFSEEINDHEAGFVAFNADYHAPRHHPPKNN